MSGFGSLTLWDEDEVVVSCMLGRVVRELIPVAYIEQKFGRGWSVKIPLIGVRSAVDRLVGHIDCASIVVIVPTCVSTSGPIVHDTLCSSMLSRVVVSCCGSVDVVRLCGRVVIDVVM